jgi:hypothetical protein
MYISTNSYVGENQLQDYINYAHKNNELQIVNLGSKKLYQIYLNNKKDIHNKNNVKLVTNHKNVLDTLIASYGTEVLVSVNNKQVRRLVLDINNVNYQELQDHLLGDFVFIYNNNLIVIDAIHYIDNPNVKTTKYIQDKLMKLKRRCHMFKHVANETVGKGSQYLSIVWNTNSEEDLLEFIDKVHEENKLLRKRYKKAKDACDMKEVARILTSIHVKTNIDLSELSFDVTEGIY